MPVVVIDSIMFWIWSLFWSLWQKWDFLSFLWKRCYDDNSVV